jgi:DNA sulfur modification protein DndC
LDDNLVIGEEEMSVLAEMCGDDRLHYELTRELLSITRQQRSSARRAGLYEALEKTFTRHFYDSKDDALSRAQRMADQRKGLARHYPQHVPVVMESLSCDEETDA